MHSQIDNLQHIPQLKRIQYQGFLKNHEYINKIIINNIADR